MLYDLCSKQPPFSLVMNLKNISCGKNKEDCLVGLCLYSCYCFLFLFDDIQNFVTFLLLIWSPKYWFLVMVNNTDHFHLEFSGNDYMKKGQFVQAMIIKRDV